MNLQHYTVQCTLQALSCTHGTVKSSKLFRKQTVKKTLAKIENLQICQFSSAVDEEGQQKKRNFPLKLAVWCTNLFEEHSLILTFQRPFDKISCKNM